MFRLIAAAALILSGLTAAAGLPQGNWKCVALSPDHLALTGDYGELQNILFLKHFAKRNKAARRKLTGWAADFVFNISGTEAIAEYRPQVAAALLNKPEVKIVSSSAPISVVRTGYWISPIGQSRFPDEHGKLRLSKNADAAHYLFLTLSRPLADGETITIILPAGECVKFVRDPEASSPLFKIDQVGYMPQAPKYAYVGAWLGTAGPMPLHDALTGKTFHLTDAVTRKTVFRGTLRPRMKDPVSKSGAPFTGEEVLELDFSRFTVPGVYRLVIPGFAASDTFRINDDTMAEAFFIHARGLYHQRCGIAKTRPYTHWTQKVCHTVSLRGNFPPEIGHYGKGAQNRKYGFTDSSGKSVTVNHFELIKRCSPSVDQPLHAPGGWHDAGDWDRRPQHMNISGDLAAVYMLKPGNFCDGQLNIPESGNGIPDILDEARWGLEHLRLKQQRDGGVGTWEETIRHPTPADGVASEDKLPYYLSCATRNSSLEYAAYAAMLAVAMRQAKASAYMEQFRDSAKRAWDYALSAQNDRLRIFHMGSKTLFYREEPELAPEFLVKAGFDLYLLTGEADYLHKAESAAEAARAAMKKNGWRRSPFFWIELEIFPCNSAVLEKLRAERRMSIVSNANAMLRQQEENYPIRVPWHGPADPWVHTMKWGTFHPLVRARTLIAAHAITGNRAYLDGALLANDFNNGANPSGSSMTSGLGRVYPVRFLDLNSYGYGTAEAVPGISPYRNTYGIPRSAVRMAYGLFYGKRPAQQFGGLALSLVPEAGLDESSCALAVGRMLPVWRRWCNVETETVDASEYTVWETIGPNAAVTGYLLNGAAKPDPRWIDRKPAADITKLPGYAPLP